MLLWPTNCAWSSPEISTSNAWGKSPSDTSGPDTETEDEGDIDMDRMDLEEEDKEEDGRMDFDIHSMSVSVSASSSPEWPKLINYRHITTTSPETVTETETLLRVIEISKHKINIINEEKYLWACLEIRWDPEF